MADPPPFAVHFPHVAAWANVGGWWAGQRENGIYRVGGGGFTEWRHCEDARDAAAGLSTDD